MHEAVGILAGISAFALDHELYMTRYNPGAFWEGVGYNGMSCLH